MNVKNSIIPALSNNNHELFHSNLWKWLIDIDKDFLNVFFENVDINKIKKLEVLREYRHMDLVIKDNEKNYFVIENKLKSIPNEEQLNEYKNKIDKESKNKSKYLIVNLIKNEQMGKNGWDSINYIDIAKRIERILEQKKKVKQVKKYYDLLKEYCDFIKKEFQRIINSKYIKNNHFCFNDKGIKPKHIEYGLKVIYQKMKSEIIKNKIDKIVKLEELNKNLENEDLFIVSLLGYYNGKPCFTYRVQKLWKNKLGEHNAIEIQLEGDQHRHMIRLKKSKGKGKKVSKKLKDEYYRRTLEICKGTDFLCKNNRKTIHGKSNNMRDDYCSYDSGKNNIGIYQYYKMKENVSYKKVGKEIKGDLEKYLRKKSIIKYLKEEK